jgi:hypothetical protein
MAKMASKIDSGLFRNPNRDLFVNIKGTKKPDEDEFSCPKSSWWLVIFCVRTKSKKS